MYLLNIYMIVRCVLWLVVILTIYYMSDQIIQLENRVDALEAQDANISADIKTLVQVMSNMINYMINKFGSLV
jgi:hypothetical protein